MKKVIHMDLAQIRSRCASPSITTENAIYQATRDTVMVTPEDEKGSRDMLDITKGMLLIRSGCGTLNAEAGSSMFMHGDIWGTIPNVDVEHYANPIYERLAFQDEV